MLLWVGEALSFPENETRMRLKRAPSPLQVFAENLGRSSKVKKAHYFPEILYFLPVL